MATDDETDTLTTDTTPPLTLTWDAAQLCYVGTCTACGGATRLTAYDDGDDRWDECVECGTCSWQQWL